MKKINFLILSAICVLFASCGENLPKSDEKNGSVTISLNGGSRTIGPNVRWSLNEIISWNVKFTDMDDDSEYAYTKAFQSASETFSLPVGNYSVYIEGKYNLPDTQNLGALTVCGSANNIVVTANQKSTAVVAVALSKTGTGTFEYNLSFDSAFEFSDDTKFVVSLYPTVEGGLSPCLDAFYDEEKGCVQFFMENIASGYYFMSVSYTIAGVEYFISIPDVLVEIADGTVTSASYLVTDASTVKTFYVKHDDSLTENGITPDHPASFTKVMNWLSKNKKSWTKANLYCLEKSADATGSVSVSEIDVDSDYCAADQKIVYYESFPVENSTLVTSEYKEVWSLTKDKFYVSQKTDFSFKSNCGTKVVLYYERAAGNAGNFILDNVTLSIKNIISPNFFESSKIYIKDAKASDSAFMVGESESGDISIVPELVDKEFSLLENLTCKYKVTKNDENTFLYKYFISEGEGASFVFQEAIPSYKIVCTSKNFKDGTFTFEDKSEAEITFKLEKTNDFNEGTNFEWKLNGFVLDSDASEITLNSLGDNFIAGMNSLKVTASFNGSSKTSLLSFKIQYAPPLFSYWENGSYYNNYYNYGSDEKFMNSVYSSNSINDDEIIDDDNIYVSTSGGICKKTNVDGYDDFEIIKNTVTDRITADKAQNKLYYKTETELYALDLNDNREYIFQLLEDINLNTISLFAANDNVLYLITEEKNNDILADYSITSYTTAFTETDGGNGLELNGSLTKKNGPVSLKTLVSVYITDYEALISEGLLKVTDIGVNESGVYVLIKNVMANIPEEPDDWENIYCRGGLITINTELSDATVIGWNSNPSVFTFSSNNHDFSVYGGTDSEAGQKVYFIGPQKIVALKPKYLIVADSGIIFSDGIASSVLKNRNRLLTLDFTGLVKTNLEINKTKYSNEPSSDDFLFTHCSYQIKSKNSQ